MSRYQARNSTEREPSGIEAAFAVAVLLAAIVCLGLLWSEAGGEFCRWLAHLILGAP